MYGQTPDISPTLCFPFYELVYYSDTNSFPPAIEKKWTGFALSLRDICTLHILMDDTHQIIYHSAVHSTLIKNENNLHLEFSEGEDAPHKPVKQVLHTWDTESEPMRQSTTLITILFLPLLRKRGDGLVSPPMSAIFSPSTSLQMIPHLIIHCLGVHSTLIKNE